WWQPQGKELVTQWRTTPVIYDFNEDGLLDLSMLDQEGYLCFFERTKTDGKWAIKAPRRLFVDEQGEPLRLNAKTAGGSGRRQLGGTDWGGDKKFDFLVKDSKEQ